MSTGIGARASFNDRRQRQIRRQATGSGQEQPDLPDLRQAAQRAYDPFCSKRCADVDLHRWLKGSYVIPGGSAKPEPGDEEE